MLSTDYIWVGPQLQKNEFLSRQVLYYLTHIAMFPKFLLWSCSAIASGSAKTSVIDAGFLISKTHTLMTYGCQSKKYVRE